MHEIHNDCFRKCELNLGSSNTLTRLLLLASATVPGSCGVNKLWACSQASQLIRGYHP